MASPDTPTTNEDSEDIIIAPENTLIIGIPSDALLPLTPEIQASDVKTYMEAVLKTPTDEKTSKQTSIQEVEADATAPSIEENKLLKVEPRPTATEEVEQPVSPEILASDVKIYIEEELKTPTEEKPNARLIESGEQATSSNQQHSLNLPSMPKDEIELTPTESGELDTPAIQEVITTALPEDILPVPMPTESVETVAPTIQEFSTTEAPTSIEENGSKQAPPAIQEEKTAASPTTAQETGLMPTKSGETATPAVQEGSSNWDDLGMKFLIIPMSRYNDIVKFAYEHFYPDEPITRSTGICQPGGPGNKMMDKFYIKDALKHGVSMMATDKEDKIIGIRIGKVIRRSQGQTFKKDDALLKVTSWVKRFLPKEYSQFFLLQKLFARMNYDVIKALDQFKCDVLYEDSLLATAKDSRLKGLGTELVRRSFEIAVGAGCEYIYTIATGEYSAKIFSKLDFTLEQEHLYEELKDKNGNQMLPDTREHKKSRIFYKKIKPDSSK